MTDRETMKQAMYLIDAWERGAYAEEYPSEIEALRQALAQPEQEPVAWITPDKENSGFLITLYEENGWTPLYTAPVSKPWVSLTEEAILEAFCNTPDLHQFVSAFKAGALWAEASLRSKNNG